MSRTSPLFSVVLANYNGGIHLKEAIDSVLEQEFADFEVVLVDDASTDGTRDVIAAYGRKFPDRVRTVLKEQNAGQGEGFNTGVAATRGRFVSFMDSDDLWFPQKLARVAADFGDPEIVAFHQHNLYLHRDGALTQEPFREFLVSGDYGTFANRLGMLPIFVATAGLTFSRETLDKVLPIPTAFRTCADGFLTRTSLTKGQVSSTNAFLGAYRVHPSNNTFANPAWDAQEYLHNLLLPNLFDFYVRNNVPWRFGFSTRDEFCDALSGLELKDGARIVLLRSAPLPVVRRTVETLLALWPNLSIDLLTQRSFMSKVAALPVRALPIEDGKTTLDALGEKTRRELAGASYDFGILPYNTWHGREYGHIHAWLGEVFSCPFAGVGTDGSLHRLATASAETRPAPFEMKKPAEEAYPALAQNPYSRWDGPAGHPKEADFANRRLRGEVFLPHFRSPPFPLSKEDRFFAIGSCFARAIEPALKGKGCEVLSQTTVFDRWIPNKEIRTVHVTNKYNALSIQQDLEFAFCPEKPFRDEFFIPTRDNKFLDPVATPIFQPSDLAEARERREQIDQHNRKIREASVLIVTLGLVEVWRDKATGVVLNYSPDGDLLRLHPGRFEFATLTHGQNLGAMEAIYRIVKRVNPDIKIIVTVSPVPLLATFSGDDIVLANTYSKSTLRSAAGEFAKGHGDVFYFPSYEMVLNNPSSWTDDLRHVRGDFAHRIVGHLLSGTGLD